MRRKSFLVISILLLLLALNGIFAEDTYTETDIIVENGESVIEEVITLDPTKAYQSGTINLIDIPIEPRAQTYSATIRWYIQKNWWNDYYIIGYFVKSTCGVTISSVSGSFQVNGPSSLFPHTYYDDTFNDVLGAVMEDTRVRNVDFDGDPDPNDTVSLICKWTAKFTTGRTVSKIRTINNYNIDYK